MKDTARLIVTMDCKRNCPDCCNKTDPSVKLAEHINDLFLLKDYPYICITGGEPLLEPKKTTKIIQRLRHFNPNVIIYIYTAAYKHTKYNKYILTWANGIHYTIHFPLALGDMLYFYKFQTVIEEYIHKSFRLYIDSRIDTPVIINPNVWYRVEIKLWMKECSLPDNEKLFILEKNYE